MIPNVFSSFNEVTISRSELEKLLREVISIKQEYRHVHAKSSKESVDYAVAEVMEGMDACWELQETGQMEKKYEFK